MEFAIGAIGTLLPKLLELLKEEYDLQKSVKKGIQFLVDELESMQAALNKVSEVPAEQVEEDVKIWTRAVREMSYEIEDKVYNFLVRASKGKDQQANAKSIKGFVRTCRNSLAKVKLRHKMAADVMDIKCRVMEAKKRRDRYNFDSIVRGNTNATTINPRIGALFKKSTELVGIEKAVDKLIDMLSVDAEDGDPKLVSVVGVGGLGKTTLAKTVFDKLKVRFQGTAFVSVGQNPDINRVFKDILYELDKQNHSTIHSMSLGSTQLIQLIQDLPDKKRYLIVIDDIWDTQWWETIRLALDQNCCGSRIITATRNLDVAKKAGNNVYHLDPLSDENSKKLFCTRIFGLEGTCPQNQPFDVPNKILQKCNGIPLAIITIASLLAGKPREEWSTVYDSIGFSYKDNGDAKNTARILSFSYYDMPPHLRTCLLYLSVFPEDYIIRKNILIRMWIAEGFVRTERVADLFDLGEKYFNELINRSMIQPVEIEGIKGLVDGCRVHDMVLGLIRSLAREENFITVFDHEYGASAQCSIRRLSIQNGDHNLEAVMNKMTHTRSLLAYSSGTLESVPSFQSFKALRVLNLEESGDPKSGLGDKLKHLGDLLQLRYLRLGGWSTGQLPEEIGNLKCLQIVDCERWRCDSFSHLPSSIGHLTHLLCLRFCSFVPDGIIRKLTSLQDLMIELAYNTNTNLLAELGNLRDLRMLNVHLGELDQRLVEASLVSLQNMHKLRHLSITAWRSSSLRWEAPGFVVPRQLRSLKLMKEVSLASLPTWINSSLLPNLCFLSVQVRSMDYRDMRVLGRLPELCCLHLYTRSLLFIYGGDGYFRKLRSCWFNSAGTVIFRRDMSGAPVMPSLEDIRFYVHPEELLKFHVHLGSQTVIGLDNIPLVEKIGITINEWDEGYMQALQALKNEAQIHPNNPTFSVGTYKFSPGYPYYSEVSGFLRPKFHQ
ncbi:hypothetical protein HU200_018016 [Digitaria exilis]|uniref:Uncharacterized protein n=1 Tax=Digitaria exilis TaxID=1010633 RepID=A0A835F575_9POAL|nr:hypothetical protein HU200_018016 [Digitaria exilis]